MKKMACFGVLIILISFVETAWAKGPVEEFLEFTEGGEAVQNRLGYTQERLKRVNTNDSSKAFNSADHIVSAGMKLNDNLVLAPRAKLKSIESEATVPGTGRRIPQELWDMRMQGLYSANAVGSTGVGIFYEVGQATDLPFRGMRNTVFRVTPYLSFGPDPKNRFIGFLDYSNFRTYLNRIPLPGFAYSFNLSPLWGWSVGFPAIRLWATPFKWLKFNLSFEPVSQIDFKIVNTNGKFLDFYLGVLSDEQNFLLNRRSSLRDQLIYRRLQWAFGTFKTMGPLTVRLGGAWEALRSFIQTDNLLRDRSNTARLLRLQNGLSGVLEAKVSF